MISNADNIWFEIILTKENGNISYYNQPQICIVTTHQ